MLRIHLPEHIEMRCTSCSASFVIHSALLNNRESLFCPFCRFEFSIYDGLSGKVRRQIYHAVRDEVERRVYEQHQMDLPDYNEDLGNVR